MLDPRRLLTFRAVAREGAFSRAAAGLHRSQPAVSPPGPAPERELGTGLLVRGRAGTTPTPAGELLLVHADALAARLALAGTQMDALAEEARRALRVGGFPSALATIVPSAAAALREDDPDLELAVEEGTVAALEDAVRAGRLDVAIGWQDAAGPRHEPD